MQPPTHRSQTHLSVANIVDLKHWFMTAPILKHPDRSLPFMVKVDASSCEIRRVLSQHHVELSKLILCAFYSRILNPAEANYNVGNWKLLSIMESLAEWRHWLKLSKYLFK